MGLDVVVGNWSARIGSYGWFASFRDEVQNKLEGGVWGSEYPLLMHHSDCDEGYTFEQADELRDELIAIQNALRGQKYPTIDYLNRAGEVVDRREKYGDDGTFLSSAGWSFGVDEQGIVLFKSVLNPIEPTDDDHTPLHFAELTPETVPSQVPSVMAKAMFNSVPYVAADHLTHEEQENAKVVKMIHSWTSSAVIFEGVIETLKEACDLSVSQQIPIEYC